MPIKIAIDQRSDGQLQVCIERHTGTGLRILGAKYDGSGKRLLSKTLSKRDAVEIREYLDEIDEE